MIWFRFNKKNKRRSMEISGKVTVLTGASAGIGLATARRFAAEGAKLVLVARSTERLRKVAAELKMQGHDVFIRPTDLCKLDDVPKMIEEAHRQYGQIDILINNAGQAVAGNVADLKTDDFRTVLDLNLWSPLLAMQAVIPLMRQTGGGLIINISSMVSKMFLPGLGGYAATKAALNLLSGTARAELAPENIRVVTMFPRMTATDFGKNSIGDARMRERQRTSGFRPGIIVDSGEQVAERILMAARNEPAEQYMEDTPPIGER
jgi:short-subunit dehydrogenase